MRLARFLRIAGVLLLVTGQGLPDDSADLSTVVRVGPGVTPPKVKYRFEPEY